MTLSAAEALEQNGALYSTSTSKKTVHTDPECFGRFGGTSQSSLAEARGHPAFKTIEHPGEIPLRARLCQYCDPTHEVER